jgi:hypothetical protein
VAVVALVGGALAGGCSSTPSTGGVPTSELRAWLRVERSVGAVFASVILTSDRHAGAQLLLDPEDQLFCNGVELFSSPGPEYRNTFAPPADGRYQFELVRRSSQENIPATLPEPPPFNLAALSAHRIGFPVTVVWGPPGPPDAVVDIQVTSDGCFQPTFARGLPDIGRAMVGPTLPWAEKAPIGCRGFLVVQRRHPVIVESPFASARASLVYQESGSGQFDP